MTARKGWIPKPLYVLMKRMEREIAQQLKPRAVASRSDANLRRGLIGLLESSDSPCPRSAAAVSTT